MQLSYRWLATALTVGLIALASIHIYAASQVEGALAAAAGNIGIGDLRLTSALPSGDPQFYSFQATILLRNTAGTPVTASFYGVEANLGEMRLGSVLEDTEQTIDPGDEVRLAAEFRISRSSMERLRSWGEVVLRIDGGIDLTAGSLWVKRSKSLPAGIELERSTFFE
jgi:hypothetical protein